MSGEPIPGATCFLTDIPFVHPPTGCWRDEENLVVASDGRTNWASCELCGGIWVVREEEREEEEK